MSERMNISAEKKSAAAAERKARRSEASRRNDELLENGNFRAFLAAIAARAGYFRASRPMPDEWGRGYRDALTDIVNGVVMNSTKGADWLRDYAAGMAEKHTNTEKTED